MPEEDTEQKILRGLDLSTLRANFAPSREIPIDRLYLGPYEVRYCNEDQRKQIETDLELEAKTLTRCPSIIVRALELGVDGIVPWIAPDGDRGFVCLRVFIAFSPRGRRVLDGQAIAFSEIVRKVRKSLLTSYWTLALFLIPIALWDRIDRQGLIATVAAIVVVIVVQYFWMRLFRRDA